MESYYKTQIEMLSNSLSQGQHCRNDELEEKMKFAVNIKELYGFLLQYVYGSSDKCHLFQPSFTPFEVIAT